MPFQFIKTDIPDVIIIEPVIFYDERGFFSETYKQTDFIKNGINYDFVQDNHSKSGKGVLRGLHYQLPPYEQGKIVRVINGAVIDVAVDIRRNSPYYGKYVMVEISNENKKMLWVPPGFAHGMYVLEDNTEFMYKCTSEYSPKHERGILWNDKDLRIPWPDAKPLLSEKDKVWPELRNSEIIN